MVTSRFSFFFINAFITGNLRSFILDNFAAEKGH